METFYKLSPIDYINVTKDADMSEQYRFFNQYLKPNSSILDVGFGSGRDMLYFKSQGHDVEGVELEEEFVDYAKSLGLKVKKMDILKYSPKKEFDAIWCCSSLVHASKEELPGVFAKLLTMIKPGGIIYCSFKYGTYEGYIAETYYTYLNEELLKQFNLNIIDMNIKKDVLSRGNDWISFIIRK